MARHDSTVQPQLSAEAQKCTLFNDLGEQLTFESLLKAQPKSTTRLLVIFIRHFFCGNCQEYVRRMSSELSPSVLPTDLSVVVIGCGASTLIASYIQVTNCKFPIFSDPSAKLYTLLGMQRSLSLGKKGPAYIKQSLASGVVKSILQGIKRIPSGDVMQAGDLDVNGGEFLLEKLDETMLQGQQHEVNWTISWSHQMANTRDHTEVNDLKCILKVDCDTCSDRQSDSTDST